MQESQRVSASFCEGTAEQAAAIGGFSHKSWLLQLIGSMRGRAGADMAEPQEQAAEASEEPREATEAYALETEAVPFTETPKPHAAAEPADPKRGRWGFGLHLNRASARLRHAAQLAHAADFGSILETLDEADHPLDPASGRQAHAKGWLLQLIGSMNSRAPNSARAVNDLYAEDVVEILFPAEPDEAPADEREAIIAELGLSDMLSAAELQRIRRAFALQNHPDRLEPEQRARATRRMTIANMLIDDLLRRRKKRS